MDGTQRAGERLIRQRTSNRWLGP